ncbi:MAG: hypothetical protein HC907_35340 [Richelia sp. SM1_7_0]|nr:hypothetical protein [Richelia sp. SM1_7_0]
MNIFLNPVLALTHNQLSAFSGVENFWDLFDTAFGTQYDHTTAANIRFSWQTGDLHQLPQIEVID